MKRWYLFLFLLFFAALEAKQTICLNMIVKNESAVIRRCLESIIPFIDYWVIVDTGSTDGTQEIIRDYLSVIPGELYERPWKNFGYNRSEAFDLAKGKGDYILFMDADDMLEYKRGYQFPTLHADCYHMRRGTKNVSYLKSQLVKGNLPWRWIGVTHEYLSCDIPFSSEFLPDVFYLSCGGGASAFDPQKFHKNIQLLEQGLKDEPHNTRYAFYLAESYRDAGDRLKAVECYQKHIAMPYTWDEEVFWSHYQIARILACYDPPRDVLFEHYHKAHRFRPHRPEPVYCLAELYNKYELHSLAYECLKGWASLPKPACKDILFYEDWMEERGIPMEFSICSYYVGKYEESLEACDQLLNLPDLSTEFRTRVEMNRAFACQKIQEKEQGFQPGWLPYPLKLALQKQEKKEYEAALQEYDLFLEHETQKESCWIAKYLRGTCYEAMGRWDEAFREYLATYQHTPERSEPLCKIASHFRTQGANDLAYMFAKQGAAIAHKQENFLSDMNKYQFDIELSIAAYYTPFRQEGFEATNKLLLIRHLPYYLKSQASNNLLFYVDKLPQATYRPIKITLPPVKPGSDRYYNPMNPSLQKTKEGYQMICRTVNYLQDSRGNYSMIDGTPEVYVRTRNFLIDYDKQFNVQREREIVEERDIQTSTRAVDGLEDCRLVNLNGENWFSCTAFHVTASGTPQIVLGKLNEDPASSQVKVENLVHLKGTNPYCEKNWLPFVKDNTIHMIYWYDPLVIYKPNLQTGECVPVIEYTPLYDFSSFRGSAAPIAFDEGYLILIHEVICQEKRTYIHRFLYFDKDFHIKKLSKPFIFQHLGIEYCCGMAIDHEGKNLVLSIGLEDREAHMCTVDLKTVRALLQEI